MPCRGMFCNLVKDFLVTLDANFEFIWLLSVFNLFTKKPLLEEQSIEWMFDVFDWCLQNFSAEFFYQHTLLVLPNNDFFPGRVDSVQGMAELIFGQVSRYAGIAHWPTSVVDQNSCALTHVPNIKIIGAMREVGEQRDLTTPEVERLLIAYNSQQINNPEGMIASFAHIIAHYMGQMAKQSAPGGAELWPHATEMTAIFLGFGLMFANSAYTFRGGCGSCYNPQANRDAYLTEQQSTYALAIFSVLKGIPDSTVTRQLKSHLGGFYKKAVKDVQRRSGELDRLNQHLTPITVAS